MSRAKGVTSAQIEALADYATHPAFDARARLVLDYATAMTQLPVAVPDELFARVREAFDAAQIVELTAAIAWENYRARFNRALLIEADGFAEAGACALPVRHPPALGPTPP